MKQSFEVNIPRIHIVLQAKNKDKAIKGALKTVSILYPHIRTLIKAGKIWVNPFLCKSWRDFWFYIGDLKY